MKLGLLIKAYMKERGLPVRKVAREMGMDHTTLWRIIQNESVDPRGMVRLFTWLLAPGEPPRKVPRQVKSSRA